MGRGHPLHWGDGQPDHQQDSAGPDLRSIFFSLITIYLFSADGQIEWAPLEDQFDIIQIGGGEAGRQYPVATGMQPWKSLLKTQFPKEEKAIEKYFHLLKTTSKSSTIHGALKVGINTPTRSKLLACPPVDATVGCAVGAG